MKEILKWIGNYLFGLIVNLCNMSLLLTNKEVATQSVTATYHDYLSMMLRGKIMYF